MSLYQLTGHLIIFIDFELIIFIDIEHAYPGYRVRSKGEYRAADDNVFLIYRYG